jgi:quinol monooxygenase YgiN
MVIGTLRIPLSPDRRVKVIEVLRSVQGRVLAQPGCTACQIYQDDGPEPAVILIQRWDSALALEEHIRSEIYRRILGAVELSGCPPEVRFDHVSTSEGMELIQRLRTIDVSREETTAFGKSSPPIHLARNKRD